MMYAYKMNSEINSNPQHHHHEHRFQIVLHRIEMDSNMLQAVFHMTMDGTPIRFTGLVKEDPSVMVAVLAQRFHTWKGMGQNMVNCFTISQFKELMEKFVNGLAIVNEQ